VNIETDEDRKVQENAQGHLTVKGREKKGLNHMLAEIKGGQRILGTRLWSSPMC
jgi:hypothetical protein